MAQTPGEAPGITPAGWPLRNFALDPLEEILTSARPRVVEISKDLLRDAVSLKSLEQALRRVCAATGAALAFAGTTDLVGAAGLPWDRYRRYLAVQVAQARFLGCTDFRPLLGGSGSVMGSEALVRRIRDVCEDASPMTLCIEVHDGPERDPAVLEMLLARTPIRIVLDLQNVQRAGYTFEHLLTLLPLDRIVYVHQRNLPGVWTEDEQTLEDEQRWHALLPETAFLWEPKTVDDPDRIRDLFDEYRRSIESIGLPAGELRRYVVDELDEFLGATELTEQEAELQDVVFALRAMAWAHTGRHLPLSTDTFEPKVRERLRRYATLTRHEPRYLHDRIPELEYGVIHFAFGHFTGQWTEFDPLKNGTVAEIHLLTEAPFEHAGRLANQVIVTFDETESIEYEIIDGASDTIGGNIVLCRIPDFLYRQAKRTLRFRELADYLSLQVLAALDGLRLTPEAIAHFHSWEGAFLATSSEFGERMADVRVIFSPYLTVGHLMEQLDSQSDSGWTMTREELGVAADQEQRLARWASSVVLESGQDRAFYERWVPAERLDVRSFARVRSAAYPSDPQDPRKLSFVAGGRPVREKGFLELCREFSAVRDWARQRDLAVDLAVLCRDRRPEKGSAYIGEMERVIRATDLEEIVHLELKVSLDQLRRRIAGSSAVIVPSLFDPYGLMATYAVEVGRPAFVSIHAGVSENVQEPAFTFDPTVEGDLLRALSSWYERRPIFRFHAVHPSYEGLYLLASAG